MKKMHCMYMYMYVYAVYVYVCICSVSVCVCMNHFAVPQKLTQHCKSTILKLGFPGGSDSKESASVQETWVLKLKKKKI